MPELKYANNKDCHLLYFFLKKKVLCDFRYLPQLIVLFDDFELTDPEQEL
jgi:hypothetical protein